MRQFKAKRERWWTLPWFLSSFWKGSCERNSANACAEVYISRDDINDVLSQFVCFCFPADDYCGTIVSLIHQTAAGFVWTLWLSCTMHCEQKLLVISEANHKKALQRDHNTHPRGTFRKQFSVAPLLVRRSRPDLWQVCPSSLWFIISRIMCCSSCVLLFKEGQGPYIQCFQVNYEYIFLPSEMGVTFSQT